jgi:predicted metalloendopeptidase
MMVAAMEMADIKLWAQMWRNVDARYRAFIVKPGNKLHLPPEQRVKLW